MELVATLAPRRHQPSSLKHVEVLGDRLPCRTQAVLGGETGAQLEECLPVPFGQLIQDGPAGGFGECLEHVSHDVET